MCRVVPPEAPSGSAPVRTVPMTKPAIVLFLAIICLALVSSCSCDRDKAIKIGFIADLTGKNSDLGVAGRDGVQLAVESINASGGIGGRMLSLVIRDDGSNPDAAALAVESLAKERVAAVVGPMGNSMAKAALPVAAKNGLVLVSPTSSSNELSGRDDNFFRVMEPNRLFAHHLAETCVKLKIMRVAAIYDLQNSTYTAEMFADFREEFLRRGGRITAEVSYDSARSPLFIPLVKKLGVDRADGVMVLANSVDAINIGQQVRKLSPRIPIISGACGIAQRDLVQQAGRSIDNIIFTLPVNGRSDKESYLLFKEKFAKRFGYEPTFASVLAYDAAQAVVAALRKNPEPSRLRETLRGIGTFPGLQGDILLDSYGDPHRKLFITRYFRGHEDVIE